MVRSQHSRFIHWNQPRRFRHTNWFQKSRLQRNFQLVQNLALNHFTGSDKLIHSTSVLGDSCHQLPINVTPDSQRKTPRVLDLGCNKAQNTISIINASISNCKYLGEISRNLGATIDKLQWGEKFSATPNIQPYQK